MHSHVGYASGTSFFRQAGSHVRHLLPRMFRVLMTMNILLIGANGYFGSHVAKELEPRHRLRVTEIQIECPVAFLQ